MKTLLVSLALLLVLSTESFAADKEHEATDESIIVGVLVSVLTAVPAVGIFTALVVDSVQHPEDAETTD